jgi:hypothetical protein
VHPPTVCQEQNQKDEKVKNDGIKGGREGRRDYGGLSLVGVTEGVRSRSIR